MRSRFCDRNRRRSSRRRNRRSIAKATLRAKLRPSEEPESQIFEVFKIRLISRPKPYKCNFKNQ